MESVIHYTTPILSGPREAVSKPDDKGYHSLILGGFNTYNTSGAYYPLKPIKELMSASSVLMRRINRGQLRSELGHPHKLPKESLSSFISRIAYIDEKNVCAHIASVSLEYTGNNNDPVYVRGNIKPAGPYAETLKQSLNNSEENTAFSLRSMTLDRYIDGVLIKHIKQIFTWDYVNEPGIAKANKWNDAGLESINSNKKHNGLVLVDNDEVIVITKDDLEEAIETTSKVSMENAELLQGVYRDIYHSESKSFYSYW